MRRVGEISGQDHEVLIRNQDGETSLTRRAQTEFYLIAEIEHHVKHVEQMKPIQAAARYPQDNVKLCRSRRCKAPPVKLPLDHLCAFHTLRV